MADLKRLNETLGRLQDILDKLPVTKSLEVRHHKQGLITSMTG